MYQNPLTHLTGRRPLRHGFWHTQHAAGVTPIAQGRGCPLNSPTPIGWPDRHQIEDSRLPCDTVLTMSGAHLGYARVST